MQLDDLGIILAPNYRSRAYVQFLLQAGLGPSVAILLPGEEPLWNGPRGG